jgi:hypothetical protein
MEGTDIVAWLARSDGTAIVREGAGSPVALGERAEAVVESGGRELRFRPGGRSRDRRGAAWHVRGDLGALALERRGGLLTSDEYPDALGRLWSALTAPHAGDVAVSLADGWECVDWGGTSHTPGGSHGSLHAGDSLCPLVLVGLEPGTAELHDQWRLCDVAALVRGHFGLGEGPQVTAAPERAADGARA